MKRFILIVCLLCASVSFAEDKPAGSGANDISPPAAPLPAGMTKLFDGKTLEGWTQVPADSWTVKNGTLASLGTGRGVIYTNKSFGSYRIMFDVRHVSGQPDHQAGVLVFCSMPPAGEKGLDALGGIQFQVPNGGHWDYRRGHNNAGKEEFSGLPHAKFDAHQWSRVEIVVDASAGIARMAVAQPVGTKAIEVLDFKEPTAAQKGPFALQMHNKGLFDQYANIAVEENPKNMDLITAKGGGEVAPRRFAFAISNLKSQICSGLITSPHSGHTPLVLPVRS